MGKILLPSKGKIFPPIGFPDLIEIYGAGAPDGVYKKIIGSIIVPPFANFNQGFYYVNDNLFYLGPINPDVRWTIVDTEANIYGLAPLIPSDRLPYNGSDWSTLYPDEAITLPRGGSINTKRYIIKELKSVEYFNFDEAEYLYKDSPFGDPLVGESTLVNMFDPTSEYGLGNNSAFTFYDGSFKQGTAFNYIDVYSDGENWRDQDTNEIANELIIPKGKSFVFYMLDSTNPTFPVSSDYLGIELVIHKLNSGRVVTDLPIAIPYPPLLFYQTFSSSSSFRVLINSEESLSTYLNQAGYEVNSFKQIIFDTYGININFDLHFAVIEASNLGSLGGFDSFIVNESLYIRVGYGIIIPGGQYFRFTLFLKDLIKFNSVNLIDNLGFVIQQLVF